MFQKKRIKAVTIDEMNKHLKYCKKYRYMVDGPKPQNETFGMKAYVEDSETYFRLTYKTGPNVCTYVCRKDNEEIVFGATGLEAYSTAQKYYKAKDFRDDDKVKKLFGYSEKIGKFAASASPFTYYSEKYNRTRNNCIGYDINSSYSNAMLGDLPDTDKPYRLMSRVGDNEVGFIEDDNSHLIPVLEKGKFATIIFPLMHSPYEKFIQNWYLKKKNAKTKQEKQKAKDTLNFCIGYMQRTNPFMRAMILYRANKTIEDLMNDDVIFCNTDSIVSLKPRDDIDIGDGIGQFKIEHEGEFAYINFSYQWNKDTPHWKRVQQTAFKKDFDILTDKLPATGSGNIVEYKNYRLEKIIK